MEFHISTELNVSHGKNIRDLGKNGEDLYLEIFLYV